MVAAEQLLEYEHRDLHLANILIRRTTIATLHFVVADERYAVATHGIRAFVIDTTFARARLGTERYYTPLSNKLERKWLDSIATDGAVRCSLTEQDLVYARMYNAARGECVCERERESRTKVFV